MARNLQQQKFLSWFRQIQEETTWKIYNSRNFCLGLDPAISHFSMISTTVEIFVLVQTGIKTVNKLAYLQQQKFLSWFRQERQLAGAGSTTVEIFVLVQTTHSDGESVIYNSRNFCLGLDLIKNLKDPAIYNSRNFCLGLDRYSDTFEDQIYNSRNFCLSLDFSLF